MAELTVLKTRRVLARTLDGATDRVRGFYENGNRLVMEPFRGVGTSEGIEEGLFSVEKTNVPAIDLKASAEEFLASLTDQQRIEATFEIDSDNWRRWSNIQNFLMRHGVCLEDLEDDQRSKALEVVKTSLSDEGFRLVRAVMERNGLLGEIMGVAEEFNEGLYWMSIFGTPSATEPWGWQIDGHHVNINCFVLGDQVVLSPMFLGSEPESTGSPASRLFESEERRGLHIMQSFGKDQFAKALIDTEVPNDCLTSSFMDNLVLDYEGISYEELTSTQQDDLLDLVADLLSRLPSEHAEQKLTAVSDHVSRSYFAWMGGVDDDSAFYYRFHNPVLVLEFCHIDGVVVARSLPNRNHIHTVIRTPNGNDYGKALLDAFRRAKGESAAR